MFSECHRRIRISDFILMSLCAGERLVYEQRSRHSLGALVKDFEKEVGRIPEVGCIGAALDFTAHAF